MKPETGGRGRAKKDARERSRREQTVTVRVIRYSERPFAVLCAS